MAGGIQRGAYLAAGAIVIALTGWLTAEQFDRLPRVHVERDGGSDGVGDAASSAAVVDASTSAPVIVADAGVLPLDMGDGGLTLTAPFLSDAGAMPSGAPRSVRIGVVLVQYAGAEGAPGSARAKPDALKQARELLDRAKTDWKGAVKAGDAGSSEDIGRVPRGVLEATTEVAIFSLAAGDISEPLDTPRGFWVVKRIE